MYRKFTLQPQTPHDVELVFEWDPDSGDLRGAGAEIVRNMCQRALQIGHVNGHPYPTPFDIADPLRNSAEMAVILGQHWQLDEWLQQEYPQAEAADDAGDPDLDQYVVN
jgi:hypothetical protein